MKKIIYMCMFAILLSLTLSTSVMAENVSSNITRLYGKDRYETSVAISKKGWNSSKYVVLARGDSFPDALCASPLAKKLNAPILLTNPDKLSNVVTDEIKRLGAENIVIIGGTGAISQDIDNQLKSKGVKTERLWGTDRYETSVEIAKYIGINGTVAIATGDNFADALSISAPAAIKSIPILLSQKSSLPQKIQHFIDSSNISKTYIIGGKGVLSDALFNNVPNPERLSGNDRYETNAAVMKKFSDGLDFKKIYMAVAEGPYGDEFADALAGSVLAANNNAPVVLVNKKLPAPVDYFIRPKITAGSSMTIFGGESVVPSSVAESLSADKSNSAVYVNFINPPAVIKPWESKRAYLTMDENDAALSVYSSNPSAVVASISGRTVTVTGITPGASVITVYAKKPGRAPGYATFLVTSPVYNSSKDKYFSTIQGAIDDAGQGNSLTVSAGIYYEHLVIKDNNLKIIGENRDTTIIDATQSGVSTKAGIKIIKYSGVEIKNLTIKNTGVNSTGETNREPYGIYVVGGSQNVFKNLYLKANGTYGIYLQDGCSYNTVENCTIDGAGVERDGYKSLDGIFSCGGEVDYYGNGLINSGNKFTNNVICNVVNGISLTAANNSWIMGNEIHALDSSYWRGYESAGVVISNSSMNFIQDNNMDSSQYGIRLSKLSSISPYAYAGSPNSNIIKGNKVNTIKNGIKIVGDYNMIQGNTITNNNSSGLWIADTAKNSSVNENVINKNKTGILIENALNDVSMNNIGDNVLCLNNKTNSMFGAEKNWWGSSTEPLGKFNGYVDYKPWALDNSCTKFSQ